MELIRKSYEDYRLNWMTENGFTIRDLLEGLEREIDGFDYAGWFDWCPHDLVAVCWSGFQSHGSFGGRMWLKVDAWLEGVRRRLASVPVAEDADGTIRVDTDFLRYPKGAALEEIERDINVMAVECAKRECHWSWLYSEEINESGNERGEMEGV